MEQLGEYDAETPLSYRYCKQLTTEEYEDEMVSTTHDALQELMDYVEKTPGAYRKIIAKRRLEEEENAGYLSYLKARLMVAIQGDQYGVSSITESECVDEVNKFQNDICEVFNYAQDSKSRGTRCSKRLQAKKRRQEEAKTKEPNVTNNHTFLPPPSLTCARGGDSSSSNESEYSLDVSNLARPPIRSGTKRQKKDAGVASDTPPSTAPPTVPPPPPPPPPPVVDAASLMSPPPAPPPISRVLLDSTNKKLHKTPVNRRPEAGLAASDGKMLKSKPKTAARHYGSTTSLASVGSIHDELLTFDKKALRSVGSVKSPGGTPLPTPRTKRLMSAPVTSPTINNMFNTKMLDKFKNIRSPPSNQNSPASPFNSTADFTDTP